MKILYAIQGTGNGHLARATEIIPHLQKFGEVDILVSGIQGDINLPFEVKYKFYGLSFMFGKKGGVDYWQTVFKSRPFGLLRDILQVPVETYDLVLNDFEPVSAWACRLKGIRCVSVSHQSAVLHPLAPRPPKDNFIARIILKYYAPAKVNYGFHFRALDFYHFTPVIRSSIRNASPRNKDHYTVYLPAYSDAMIEKLLSRFAEVKWEVFSKKCRHEYQIDNIRFSPVSLDGFHDSFVNCSGLLCNAGFEAPSEAIFLGKKLCVIPMKNQYEQACNAAMLSDMGISVANKANELPSVLKRWIKESYSIRIKFPDQTHDILRRIMMEKRETKTSKTVIPEKILIRAINCIAASSPVSSHLRQRPL